MHNVSYLSDFVKNNENIDNLCAKSGCDYIAMFYIVICILTNVVLLCCVCAIVKKLILLIFFALCANTVINTTKSYIVMCDIHRIYIFGVIF